jgi:hypothetical protein
MEGETIHFRFIKNQEGWGDLDIIDALSHPKERDPELFKDRTGYQYKFIYKFRMLINQPPDPTLENFEAE